MEYRISAVLLVSLMLSMLFMPLAVAADDGKSIIKEMVQAPADYSVGIIIFIPPYSFWELDRHWPNNGYDINRPGSFPFLRLFFFIILG